MMGLINLSLFILLYRVQMYSNALTGSAAVSPETSATKPKIFQLPLDHENKYRLFWTLDYETKFVTIEARATLDKRNDWFALGFSNDGNVSKADLCVLWFDKKQHPHFEDTWTDEASYVNIDESNDCNLLNLTRKGSTVRVVFQRKFETCDSADYVIEDGTTHVVYASGRGPLKRLEGLKLADHRNGFVRVRLLKDLKPSPEMPLDTRMIEITNRNVDVPSDDTTYWCSLHELPNEMNRKHHVIQYEAIVQEGNEKLVHHMEVFHCEIQANELLPGWNGRCSDKNKPPILEHCKRVIAAWAMGAGPLAYPVEAGLPIGGSNYSKYLMLEIHYDNPGRVAGVADNSGIRFYYVSSLRDNDIGIMELGLEYTDKNSIPPRQVGFELSAFCVAECTRAALPPNGVTIVASQLHTHLTGAAVWTKHVRGGSELPEVNRDNHYSQHFQEIRLLKEPVTLFPGDALVTTCRYDTRQRTNVTLSGFAISEEMCVNYVHYFPKTDLEVCKSSIDSRFLAKYFDYMRQNEGTATDSARGIADNYRAIPWSANNAEFLKKLYDSSPLSMQCNHSNGERYPGSWEGIQQTRVYEKLDIPKPCVDNEQ